MIVPTERTCPDCNVRLKGRAKHCPQCRERRRRPHHEKERAHDLLWHYYAAWMEKAQFRTALRQLSDVVEALLVDAGPLGKEEFAGAEREAREIVEEFADGHTLGPSGKSDVWKTIRDHARHKSDQPDGPVLRPWRVGAIWTAEEKRPIGSRHKDPKELDRMAHRVVKRALCWTWDRIAKEEQEKNNDTFRATVRRWARNLDLTLPKRPRGRPRKKKS